MAIKRGDVYFTYVLFCENGEIVPRRYEEIDIQARGGGSYRLKGKELPDGFVFRSGKSRTGGNLARILLDPKNASRLPNDVFEARPWPCGRDVLNFAIGFFAVMMLRFFASLLGMF